MANFEISVTMDDVFIGLRSFLLAGLAGYSGTEVVQGQVNRVSPPRSVNYVVMWPLRSIALATNVDSWNVANPAPTSIDMDRSTQVDIQLDVHGPDSSDIANIITMLWRSTYGVEACAAYHFDPLYAVDPRQIPFITGEGQYETRWVIELRLQITPRVSTPMQFADKLTPTVIVVP